LRHERPSLGYDRERALHHVVEAQDQLKRVALILRRTSGYYDDPTDSDRKRKRELEQNDWTDIGVRARRGQRPQTLARHRARASPVT
jgi:hypothetical protein